MSLFNPLKNQYARLMELSGSLPCCDLDSAAAVMRIKKSKVQKNLGKLIDRGMFGENHPYIDQEMSMIVMDKRYHPFACIYSSACRLKLSLKRAANVCIFTPQERSRVRSRTAHTFLADMVDAAFSGYGAGRMLRDRGANYLHDFLDPDRAMPNAEASDVISLLGDECDSLLSFLRMNPEIKPNPLQIHFVNNTERRVLSFIKSYPDGSLPSAQQQQTAQGIIEQLRDDSLPRFKALLNELARTDEASQTGEVTPTAELQEQASRLMALSCQMNAGSMRTSVSRIAGQLNEIAIQLEYAPARAGAACVRSLRTVYLPMMQELLTKYLRYDRIPDAGNDVKEAMKSTENIFKNDLPKALKQVLKELQGDSAIDLVSQAEALKKKMELDGLLDPLEQKPGNMG